MPVTTPNGAPRTARERARAELTREIKEEARRQLADAGANGLSLRAVARELGMVSSALYRYYPSRDELLTALIIDAYDALGEAAEQAIAGAGAAAADHADTVPALGEHPSHPAADHARPDDQRQLTHRNLLATTALIGEQCSRFHGTRPAAQSKSNALVCCRRSRSCAIIGG